MSKINGNLIKIDNYDHPVIIVNKCGKIMKVNSKFTKMTSFTKEFIISQNLSILIPTGTMSKKDHEDKMNNFNYDKSKKLGKIMVLPILTPKEIKFVSMSMFIITVKKEINFIVYLSEKKIKNIFINDSLNDNYLSNLFFEIDEKCEMKKSNKNINDIFRESIDKLFLEKIKYYLQNELSIIIEYITFFKDLKICEHFIKFAVFDVKIGNLHHVYNCISQKLRNKGVMMAYSTLICVRIIFPTIISIDPSDLEMIAISSKLMKNLNNYVDSQKLNTPNGFLSSEEFNEELIEIKELLISGSGSDRSLTFSNKDIVLEENTNISGSQNINNYQSCKTTTSTTELTISNVSFPYQITPISTNYSLSNKMANEHFDEFKFVIENNINVKNNDEQLKKKWRTSVKKDDNLHGSQLVRSSSLDLRSYHAFNDLNNKNFKKYDDLKEKRQRCVSPSGEIFPTSLIKNSKNLNTSYSPLIIEEKNSDLQFEEVTTKINKCKSPISEMFKIKKIFFK